MAADQGLVDWVIEAMEPIGTVIMRRMMGGATLYCDTIIFAIVDEDQIWFKADAMSDAIWDTEGCPRFVVDMGEKGPMSMNYRRAPEDVYDDAEALQRWAALGLEAGRRAPVKKKRASATGRKRQAKPDS